MTELPTCWIERPSLFAAPALEPDPARRALLVLKWFVVALRSLLYVGEGSKLGMKKPLNPFLGEVCVGCCVDEGARVGLVVEQVRYVFVCDVIGEGRGAEGGCSHHPPVGACYFWDEEHGIQVGFLGGFRDGGADVCAVRGLFEGADDFQWQHQCQAGGTIGAAYR